MAQPDARSAAPEARTGLDPWGRAELPAPPSTKGLRLLGVVGPGVIVLGASIGSGEWLIGPTAFVKYGMSLLWVTTVAVTLQTILNTEAIRYTLYTGEPVFTGFMRTRPRSTFWAWTYAPRAGLVATALFYGFFVFLWLSRALGPKVAAAVSGRS